MWLRSTLGGLAGLVVACVLRLPPCEECSGECVPALPDGDACEGSSMCASGFCLEGICASGPVTGEPCTTACYEGRECIDGICGGPEGAVCSTTKP